MKLANLSTRLALLSLQAILLAVLCSVTSGFANFSGSSAHTLLLPAAPRTLSSGGKTGGADFAPGTLLVKPAREGEDLWAVLGTGSTMSSKDGLAPLGVLRIRVPVGQEMEALRRLRASPRVEWAEPDYLRASLDTVPNDQLYRQFQWNLRKIQAEQAWDITTGSPEVVVALLDTGIDRTHPDLAGKLVAGYDLLNDNPDPADDSGHGTHKAGVVAAATNNGLGVAGLSWSARVMPLKVLNSSGIGPDSAIARGITYAVDHGARILNMSFGSSTSSKLLSTAVDYALGKGALLVAAAGNTARQDNATIYPAAFEGVMAVTATDEGDKVVDFSQHHSYVSVSAPGSHIVSTFWRGAGYGSYVSSTGTSDAAPHVSGLAALIWSANPGLTNLQVKKLIEDTSDDLGPPGRDEYYGAGRINAFKALQAAKPAARPAATVPPSPPAPTPIPGPLVAPATVPKSVWYFGQAGATLPFDLWLLLQNPNAEAAAAKVTYTLGNGSRQTQELWLPPNSRKSVYVNQVVANPEVSMKVESDALLFAERAVFHGTDGRDTIGVAAPSTRWYLAEGNTKEGFDSWVLLQNPQEMPAVVTVTFLTSKGERKETTVRMPVTSTQSLHMNELIPDAEVSTIVTSDQPIIAERATYFGKSGGHGSVGSSQLSRTWYLADGRVGDGFDTWFLVLNPNSATANLKVTFTGEDGLTYVGYYAAGPNSRLSIYLNSSLPAGRFGSKIESDQPVVAERSSYYSASAGGQSVTGSPLLSREWYLPEGSTNPPFTETITVLNPGDQPAEITLTFMGEGSRSDVRRLKVNPNSLLVLKVNDLLPEAEFSTKLVADAPVAVERSMAFSNGPGGTSSPGVPR